MKKLIVVAIISLGFLYSFSLQGQEINPVKEKLFITGFIYKEITGIGYEKGVSRRDPSDIIKAGDSYIKYDADLIENSHEVLIWNQNGGVSSLASISQSLYFAPNGLNFLPVQKDLVHIPRAPGLYRPHLTDHSVKEIPGWGISHRIRDGEVYLIRFEMN